MCNDIQYGVATWANFDKCYVVWTRLELFIDWINEILSEVDDEVKIEERQADIIEQNDNYL